MTTCYQCPDCGQYSPSDQWETVGGDSSDDIEGYVDADCNFQAFDTEIKAACALCGSVSEHYA